jgi:vacuolar-type H+-ATPase subunit H
VGEMKDGKWHLNFNKLKMYAVEIFNIQDVKLEEFIELLKQEKLIELAVDQEDATKVLITKEPDMFRVFQVFFNAQRTMKDDKKLKISTKGEKFITKLLEQVEESKVVDGKQEVNLSTVIKYFKDYNIAVTLDDFQPARLAKFCTEYKMEGDGQITTILNVDYVLKMFPVIKFMNALNRVNEAKAK